MDNLCPPEICIEKPSQHNYYRWCWGVYQPDQVWAPIVEGYGIDRSDCVDKASRALNRVMAERRSKP